jgi:hypothetical protein
MKANIEEWLPLDDDVRKTTAFMLIKPVDFFL